MSEDLQKFTIPDSISSFQFKSFTSTAKTTKNVWYVNGNYVDAVRKYLYSCQKPSVNNIYEYKIIKLSEVLEYKKNIPYYAKLSAVKCLNLGDKVNLEKDFGS